MARTVALQERSKLAALLRQLLQEVRQQPQACRIDKRSLRTWQQLILGIWVKRTSRMLGLAQVVGRQRRAKTAKVVATQLGDWLAKAKFPLEQVSCALLEAILCQLEPEALVTYRGRVLLAVDPTDYQKRSRGRGKRGRQMQYVGQVRKTKSRRKPRGEADAKAREPVATTRGYTDVWAGLVLKGKQFLPLVRQLFSNEHPDLMSQNQVEEAVLSRALDCLRRVGLPAIVLGDRGLGRKALLIKLANDRQPFVIRIDDDIQVWGTGSQDGKSLADALQTQPWIGETEWDRGQEGKLHCLVRTLRATIRYSRSGRVHDYEEATLNFIELVPIDGYPETLLLATTLAVTRLGDARTVARLYAYRWAIETGFETMKAWGLGRFMVRKFVAIERLLWVVAVAYALAVLALCEAVLQRFRQQAVQVLRRLTVVGRRLTPGKLSEAIGLDFADHRRAWMSVWLK